MYSRKGGRLPVYELLLSLALAVVCSLAGARKENTCFVSVPYRLNILF